MMELKAGTGCSSQPDRPNPTKIHQKNYLPHYAKEAPLITHFCVNAGFLDVVLGHPLAYKARETDCPGHSLPNTVSFLADCVYHLQAEGRGGKGTMHKNP